MILCGDEKFIYLILSTPEHYQVFISLEFIKLEDA